MRFLEILGSICLREHKHCLTYQLTLIDGIETKYL
nr:MAG TPA: hypothetical protein [Caudoviricetes sp.]